MSFSDLIEPIRRAVGLWPNAYARVDNIQAMSPMEGDTGLPTDKSYVFDHGTTNFAINSERVLGPRPGLGVEALATRPLEIQIKVPEEYKEEDFKEGKPITAQGPHGPLSLVPPPGIKAGEFFKYRLAPLHEFRCEVPAGAKPGFQFNVTRQDGVKICVQVPPNLKPGDIFEVLPPALMVRVPDGVLPGQFVLFRNSRTSPQDGMEIAEWCRAQVPPGAMPGMYFACRLPLPEGVTAPAVAPGLPRPMLRPPSVFASGPLPAPGAGPGKGPSPTTPEKSVEEFNIEEFNKGEKPAAEALCLAGIDDADAHPAD